MIRKPFRDRSRKGKYLLAKKIKLSRSENENKNVNVENQPENVKTSEQNLIRYENSAVFCENPVPSTSSCQNDLSKESKEINFTKEQTFAKHSLNQCPVQTTINFNWSGPARHATQLLEDVEHQNTVDISNSDIDDISTDESELEYANTQKKNENRQDNAAENNCIFEESENEENDDQNEGNNNEDASDEDSNDAAEEEQFDDNRPLYAGAHITVAQSMLLILSLTLKHNLTATSIADIITVINLHCPNEDFQKNSLYKFKKYFSWSTDEFIKHYYCSVCTTSLVTKNSICETCQANKGVSYFIEMPFIKQLALMFQRNSFRELLQHRFQREGELRSSSFRDIYDGSLYQQYVQNEFLSNPSNISFTWYTDGIPVFKSSHISIWPVYLTINELPYKFRMKRENIVFVGLWFGSNKPSANHFMYKFRPKFETLFRGQNITLPDQNLITVRGIVLAGTCDLPAKAQFLNMMQYNGEFGCNHCKDKGESFTHPITRGTSRVYPYNRHSIMRTSTETIENAKQALQDKHPVNGVKGPCALSKLMPDFIQGTAIDYMHCIFSGVIKKLLHFWFDSSFSGEPFSLHALSGVVDTRLISIKPPKFVHRMPRTVLDLCHWKASELKMWFFYYSVPILEGIMNPIYFRHYLLLVSGISLLNSSYVTSKNVEDAEHLLHKFVRECSTLYGIQFCSINVHQILHLPDCVRRLGPLWVYSCFPYEDINGKMLKLVHGTTHIESQIASGHYFLIKMKKKLDELPEGPIHDFITDFKHQVKINERISVDCYSVGSYKRMRRLPLYIQQALMNSNLPLENVHTYLRLLKDSKLFIGEMYDKAKSTLSSYVVYKKNQEEKLGVIHCFVKISECDCGDKCICEGEHFAIITEIIKDGIFHVRGDAELWVQLSYLHKCHRGSVVAAIPVASLKSVCIYININNQSVIGQVINSVELE